MFRPGGRAALSVVSLLFCLEDLVMVVWKSQVGDVPRLLVDAKQAAAMLNISTRLLYDLLKAGLPSVKVRGRRLFRPESLMAWISEKEQAGQASVR